MPLTINSTPPLYQLPGNNARAYVAMLEDRHAYSRYVAAHLIPSMRRSISAEQERNGNLLIVATCVFSPSLFYNEIKDEMCKRDHAAKEKIIAFEKDCMAFNPNASQLSDSDSEHQEVKERSSDSDSEHQKVKEMFSDFDSKHQEMKEMFMDATSKVWPHFITLQELGENVVRLCTICYGDGFYAQKMKRWENLSLYRQIFRTIKPATLAFFMWLNQGCRCYILEPPCWKEWGIAQPRDFALLNNNALIEFHEKQKVFVYTEDLLNWEFIYHQPLLEKLNAVLKNARCPKGCVEYHKFLSDALGPQDARDSLARLLDIIDKKIHHLAAQTSLDVGEAIAGVSTVIKNIKAGMPDLDVKKIELLYSHLAYCLADNWTPQPEDLDDLRRYLNII